METKQAMQFLEFHPDSLYRQPFLKGTRIRAEIVYGHTFTKEDEEGVEAGRSPQEIAEALAVPIDAVHEAIDWCRRNWKVVIADHAREDLIMEASGMNDPDYKRDPARHSKILTAEQWTKISNDDDLPR